MPRLTQWTIRLGFLYLLVAMTLAAVLALPPGAGRPAWLAGLGPVYLHLLVVGWVTQMIFAVIFWMFPIISRARPRGSERVAWIAFGLLNAGLLLRAVGEPLLFGGGSGSGGWLLVGSAILQWLAVAGLVFISWPRVRDRYRSE